MIQTQVQGLCNMTDMRRKNNKIDVVNWIMKNVKAINNEHYILVTFNWTSDIVDVSTSIVFRILNTMFLYAH